MQTVCHVTHEAVQKIGGIGAVLQGLLTSKNYLASVPRNILIGPFWPGDGAGEDRLGPRGEVLYSSRDCIQRTALADKLREIENAFGVGILYGRRNFIDNETGVTSSPEVLLIDVARYDVRRISLFKFRLWEKFGIDSGKYEHIWDFEQYMRLAEPAIAALHVLGTCQGTDRCVILSHEYMGVPTALAAILDAPNFRTVFHAHECATMRRIVEHHDGHDTMFYNVMRAAMADGRFVDETFGDQSDFYKHALIRATRHFDSILAVGDCTLEEMRFLGPEFSKANAHLAYNGTPHWRITPAQKAKSRRRLQNYCNTLLKFTPDYVFTHVTRLVPSKGLWRDLRVLEHVEQLLRERNQTAVLITLSTEVPARRIEDIHRMENEYHWPVAHREGTPDLSHGEADHYLGVQEFNAQSRNVKVIFINQFGFDRQTCGSRVAADMEFMDIRKGSDAEFGQSIYEPFGIAQVEPLSFGGICIMTNICGCAGFLQKVTKGQPTDNVIIADYTKLPDMNLTPEQLLKIDKSQREAIEREVAGKVARELVDRLPRTTEQFEKLINCGYELASQMSWDAVVEKFILPQIL